MKTIVLLNGNINWDNHVDSIGNFLGKDTLVIVIEFEGNDLMRSHSVVSHNHVTL